MGARESRWCWNSCVRLHLLISQMLASLLPAPLEEALTRGTTASLG